MPNFADYGLAVEGMNQRASDDQRLALGAQQIESGQMGLDEAKRARDVQAKYRSAVAATTPEEGRLGVYHRISKEALGAGDADTYAKAEDASRKLQEEGFGQLAMHALTGTPPQEAAKAFNATGITRVIPETLEYGKDPKTGDILVRGMSVADNKPYTFNATQYARLHGIVKQNVHTIPAGGALAVTEPGQPTQVVEGRNKTFSPSQGVIHVTRSVDGESKTYAYDLEGKKWIGGAPPGENGAPPEAVSGAGVRKNLPVLKAVDEAISKIPGAVNKMDLTDPLHPYYEWTPKGQAFSLRAQRLYLANPNLPPELIRDIVSSPDLQARVVNGEEAELKYKGKIYKLGESGGTPSAAPSAATATAAAPAIPAPAPTKPAPKAEPKPAPKKEELKTQEAEPKYVEPTVEQRRTDFARRQEQILKRQRAIANDPELRALDEKQKQALRSGKAAEANNIVRQKNELIEKRYPLDAQNTKVAGK